MPDAVETVFTVDVMHEEELGADGFDVFVTVRGSSVFTGSAVFEKAAEVKSLVGAVAATGVARDDVSLVGIQVDVESGLLTKSSSARYSLRIRSRADDRLSAVLTAIASAKNATVDHLDWRYPEGEEAKQRWLRVAVAKARGRADAMADELGMAITGVKRVSTPVTGVVVGPVPHALPMQQAYGGPARARGLAGNVDLGLQLAPTKRVAIDVRVELVAAPR